MPGFKSFISFLTSFCIGQISNQNISLQTYLTVRSGTNSLLAYLCLCYFGNHMWRPATVVFWPNAYNNKLVLMLYVFIFLRFLYNSNTFSFINMSDQDEWCDVIKWCKKENAEVAFTKIPNKLPNSKDTLRKLWILLQTSGRTVGRKKEYFFQVSNWWLCLIQNKIYNPHNVACLKEFDNQNNQSLVPSNSR